jgi:hypothetical protein
MRKVAVVVAISIGALAVVIAVSGAIGAVATPTGHHAYNWSVATLVATALGTLALAVATGALAWSTRSDATDIGQPSSCSPNRASGPRTTDCSAPA